MLDDDLIRWREFVNRGRLSRKGWGRKEKMKPQLSELESELAFLLKNSGFPPWEVEYRFDDVRRWRFDFAWPDLKVAAECEGGLWSGGRHTRPAGFEGDCEKYDEATLAGWKVLRFTGKQIKSGYALDALRRAIKI